MEDCLMVVIQESVAGYWLEVTHSVVSDADRLRPNYVVLKDEDVAECARYIYRNPRIRIGAPYVQEEGPGWFQDTGQRDAYFSHPF